MAQAAPGTIPITTVLVGLVVLGPVHATSSSRVILISKLTVSIATAATPSGVAVFLSHDVADKRVSQAKAIDERYSRTVPEEPEKRGFGNHFSIDKSSLRWP